ncbi:hypothetical protein [Streptosporangium sandarakinum]|uniref:hypothetical protein n=1 Tax=Streptosporangium sandarakinum TaxID=1260955 RepID=UPI00344AEEFF
MILIKKLATVALAVTLALPPANAAAAPTVATSESAPSGKITDLGVPLQDVLLIGGAVAPGPRGKTVLWSASSGAPAKLNAVDPVTGAAAARFDLPGAGGSWAVDATPDGGVYVGSYGDGRLYRWTEQGGVQDLGRPIASEDFIWSVAPGEGATVYGGTSIYGGQSATQPTQPEAKLFAWSVRQDKLLWEMVPAPGKPAISGLTFDDRGRLWGIAGGTVFTVNTAARRVVSTVTLSASTSASGKLEFDQRDRMLYGAHAGTSVFRLDPGSRRHTALREGPVHQLAVHRSGDVYFAEGPRLFRYEPQIR